MRLATLATAHGTSLALTLGDTFVDITQALLDRGVAAPPRSVTDIVMAGQQELGPFRELVQGLLGSAPRLPLAQCRVLPPHLPTANVFCVGVNYREHVREGVDLDPSLAMLTEATYFSKDARSFCGAFDDIAVDPSLTSMLDWEVELAVVIGRPGYRISPDQALEHVFGYTIVNDVSARDLQMARGQWFLGKNLMASSPIGPYVVTADEIDDPQALTLTCSVDGVVKQQAGTSDMVHSVAELIADLSRFLPLKAGDVIATGTPAGVGAAGKPPQFLSPGSTLVSEISGIGRMQNLVTLRSPLS